jgi:hypothetical protein
MSITVVNYLDQELVNRIQEQAAARTAAASASSTEGADFAASLNESTKALSSGSTDSNGSSASTQTTSSASTVSSPQDYEAYFKEASETYGVATSILKSIAKAESNFNPSAVSKAGAIGIMQLMPSTAASLGVSNSYDARENIMGGAKYISQLLSRYQGNISLALAAYNAGTGNVDKYGGIPPFTETQNYVQKVLSYMNGSFETDYSSSGIFGLTGEARDTANEMLGNFFAANNISKSTLDILVSLLKLKNLAGSLGSTGSSGTSTSATSGTTTAASSTASGNSVSSETAEPVLPSDTTAAASSASLDSFTEDFPEDATNRVDRNDINVFPLEEETDSSQS